MKKDEWKLIGEVGVDSGQLMICDPCYIDSEWKKEKYGSKSSAKNNFSYNSVSQATIKEQFAQLFYKLGHAGVGVAFRSGLGDGCYPVYAKTKDIKGWGKRVTEVKIVLIEDCALKGLEL